MASLLSLTDAKRHLRVYDDAHNAEVEAVVERASGLLVDYIGTAAAAAWTVDTAPDAVVAGVWVLIAHLYENRGEDMKADEQVWESVKRRVERYRTPVLA